MQPPRVRRKLNDDAQRAPDVVYRMRCKIVRSLVRGVRPVVIAEVLACAYSQVFRVAKRFVEEGPNSLPDRRADNGGEKVTEGYACLLLAFAAESPRIMAMIVPHGHKTRNGNSQEAQ